MLQISENSRLHTGKILISTRLMLNIIGVAFRMIG